MRKLLAGLVMIGCVGGVAQATPRSMMHLLENPKAPVDNKHVPLSTLAQGKKNATYAMDGRFASSKGVVTLDGSKVYVKNAAGHVTLPAGYYAPYGDSGAHNSLAMFSVAAR